MTQETLPTLTEKEVVEILWNFDRVLTAYVFHLEAMYHSTDDEEIIVCWECIQRVVTVHGGHEVLNEYINEGKGRYKTIKQKLRRLGLI